MPFAKALPEWNGVGSKPPQSKLNSGWAVAEKPPADWWNWFNNTTYQSIKELQENALHIEKIGIASGIATLGTDGKVPTSQLPAATAVSDATTTNKGIVQLNDNINSTSLLQAATANAVKKTYDVATGKYTKPSSGIPKTDLDTSVQTSLAKADAALSSITTASTTSTGIVKLNDTLTSISTTEAATANVAKAINDSLTAHKNDSVSHITSTERTKWNNVATTADKISVTDANNRFTGENVETVLNELFLYASNGKTSIANAAGAPSVSSDAFTKIASDITTGKKNIATAIRSKGGTISDTASWETIKVAVDGIALGKKFASGVIATQPNTGSSNLIEVTGLNFKPEVVYYTRENGLFVGGAYSFVFDESNYIIFQADNTTIRQIGNRDEYVKYGGFKFNTPIQTNYKWVAIGE